VFQKSSEQLEEDDELTFIEQNQSHDKEPLTAKAQGKKHKTPVKSPQQKKSEIQQFQQFLSQFSAAELNNIEQKAIATPRKRSLTNLSDEEEQE